MSVDDDHEQARLVDEARCLGCGVCAFFCPGDAIRQTESDRIVRIAPLTPKKEIDSWVKEKL